MIKTGGKGSQTTLITSRKQIQNHSIVKVIILKHSDFFVDTNASAWNLISDIGDYWTRWTCVVSSESAMPKLGLRNHLSDAINGGRQRRSGPKFVV